MQSLELQRLFQMFAELVAIFRVDCPLVFTSIDLPFWKSVQINSFKHLLR
jgi:hypothetical protein